MIKSESVKDAIEILLNNIAYDNNYDVSFVGKVDFYDHQWIKANFGVDNEKTNITPFVLTSNLLKKRQDNTNTFDFRYTIVALPFDKDREIIRDIFHKLSELLDKDNIDNYNFTFMPSNVAFGADFSEGSGLGFLRFEALFEFEGFATTNYGISDIELELNHYIIPVNSFKYEQMKANIVNKDSNFDNENNINLNENLLVIETTLSPDNLALTTFLNKGQNVNLETWVELKIGGETIIDNPFVLSNHTIAYDSSNDRVVAYLFFDTKGEKASISIGDAELPILDYAITTSHDIEPHIAPNTNIVRNIFLGRIRGYSFNVSETEIDNNNKVLERLYFDLIDDVENMPTYEVSIKIGNNTFLKRLLLTDIAKQVNESNKSIITLKFVDGSDI